MNSRNLRPFKPLMLFYRLRTLRKSRWRPTPTWMILWWRTSRRQRITQRIPLPLLSSPWNGSYKTITQHVLHILDDIFIAEPTRLKCLTSFSTLLRVFMSLHAPVVASKTLGPSQELEFMGIVLDSIRMEARLPDDKLNRTRELLNSFTQRRSVRPFTAIIYWHPSVCVQSRGPRENLPSKDD